MQEQKNIEIIDEGAEQNQEECPKVKRRKLDKKELSIHNNCRRWSSQSQVEEEFLQDMGIGMLNDEDTDGPNSCLKKICEVQDENIPPRSCKEIRKSSFTNSENIQSSSMGSLCQSEEFFLFTRRKSSLFLGEDVFAKLSDEIVLQIFRWLPKKVLVRCAQVCKRWHRIANDEELWTRLDLAFKTLKSGSLGQLMAKGIVILKLTQANIPDPICLPNSSAFKEGFSSKLQYLDLSMAVISEQGLADILTKCRNLRKLSIEHCWVNEKACKAIGLNAQLDILNMSACYGLNENGVYSIVVGCRKLASLNLAWTGLSTDSLNILCKGITYDLQRINISGCRNTLTDKHVRELTESCPNLVELDLSDCTTLTEETIDIVCDLNKIEYLAFSRCYNIPIRSYLNLASVKTLMYLDIFGTISGESCLAELKEKLPHVRLNKFLFSSVARPTVGIRRTSIWGLSVKN